METVNPSILLRVNGEQSRTIKFYTLGCKVNQYDTQSIRERFIQAGFRELDDSQPADIYVINTCTVTDKADTDSLNFIRKAKRENPKAKIMVTGCLAELDEDKIKSQTGVSLIVKNKDKEKINPHKFIRANSAFNSWEFVSQGISFFKGHTRAFLKIQDGCNNLCSYCKVPLVRGVSRSKSLEQIIYEADRLVKNGFKEIVLCGICLGAYGRDLNLKVDLVEVIGELEKINGLLRIRLSSIETSDISDDLITKIFKSKKLCPHLHIPFQSGDDEILRKMNRQYTLKDYLNLIQRIKERIPEIAITTDIMVGFPGETEENFQNTINLIKQVLPLKVHIFPYSSRNGTVARDFKDRLSPMIVKERIQRLKDISLNCSLIYKFGFLNKKMEVLIEERVKEDKGYWQGYTRNYLKVRVKSGFDLKNKVLVLELKKIGQDYIMAL